MKKYCFLFLVIGCGGDPFTSGYEPLNKVGVNNPDGSPTGGSSSNDSGVMPQAGEAGQMDIPDAGSMEDASGGTSSAGTSSAGSAGINSSGGAGSSSDAGSSQGGMDAGVSGQGGNSGMNSAGASGTSGSSAAGNSGNSGTSGSGSTAGVTGSTSCNTGDLGCACYGNSTCNGSLICQNSVCIQPCKTLNGVPGQLGETWKCSDQSIMTECIYQDIYKAYPSFAPAGWNGVAYRGIDCTNSKFHLLYATGGSCSDAPLDDFLNSQLTGMPAGCPYK